MINALIQLLIALIALGVTFFIFIVGAYFSKGNRNGIDIEDLMFNGIIACVDLLVLIGWWYGVYAVMDIFTIVPA